MQSSVANPWIERLEMENWSAMVTRQSAWNWFPRSINDRENASGSHFQKTGANYHERISNSVPVYIEKILQDECRYALVILKIFPCWNPLSFDPHNQGKSGDCWPCDTQEKAVGNQQEPMSCQMMQSARFVEIVVNHNKIINGMTCTSSLHFFSITMYSEIWWDLYLGGIWSRRGIHRFGRCVGVRMMGDIEFWGLELTCQRMLCDHLRRNRISVSGIMGQRRERHVRIKILCSQSHPSELLTNAPMSTLSELYAQSLHLWNKNAAACHVWLYNPLSSWFPRSYFTIYPSLFPGKETLKKACWK